MPVAVKICGVRRPEDALTAAEAGADLIGLIFAPSRRQIDVPTAGRIVAALRNSSCGQHVTVVGVFVDEAPSRIMAIADAAGLDWVQLSGHEPLTTATALDLPALKTLRFDGDASEGEWLAQPAACDGLPVHVDAHVAGSFGGAGVVADWQAAARLAEERPVLLAGGLTPANVAAAIAAVRPWGVDVSSGVETDGIKDPEKIQAFIQAAKATQRSATPPVQE